MYDCSVCSQFEAIVLTNGSLALPETKKGRDNFFFCCSSLKSESSNLGNCNQISNCRVGDNWQPAVLGSAPFLSSQFHNCFYAISKKVAAMSKIGQHATSLRKHDRLKVMWKNKKLINYIHMDTKPTLDV